MKVKHVVTVFCSALMIFIFGLYSAIATPEKEKKLKVGFIYVGDGSNPYTNNFMRAQDAVEEKYGEQVETIAMYNVPEGDTVAEAIDELIKQECDMIFATSYGYGEYMKAYAKDNPDIQFCQATCNNANDTPKLDNYHTYMGFVYQGRYIAGVVAGMKLQELLDEGKITKEDLWIGYVGAFPHAEVISGYTAFYLGAASVVPDVKMRVKYTNTWGDYKVEKLCAEELIEEGCIIISQHSDTTGPAVACENTSADTVVYHIGYNQTMLDVAPTTSLISCRIDWKPYTLHAVDAVLKGDKIESDINASTFGNDSGAGFDKGWIQTLELNELVAADGTKEKIEELEKKFEAGEITVFKGNYVGVNPYDPADTIDLSEGFEENANASAPSFCYVLKDVIIVEDDYLPVTLEYFENVNKEYTFGDIANEIGPNSGITGSGIIYYVWDIDENIKAKLLFSGSDGKISRIQISGIEEKDVVLYNRGDEETPTTLTIKGFKTIIVSEMKV